MLQGDLKNVNLAKIKTGSEKRQLIPLETDQVSDI